MVTCLNCLVRSVRHTRGATVGYYPYQQPRFRCSHANGSRGILGYWEPTHGPDGTLGIGCMFPEGNIPMDRKYGHGLAKINVRSGEPLVYYTGAAWDKAGLITSGDAWFDYLSGYVVRLKNPPVIQVCK